MKDECPKCRTTAPEGCHSMQCPMRPAPTVATDNSGEEDQYPKSKVIEMVDKAFDAGKERARTWFLKSSKQTPDKEQFMKSLFPEK